MHHVGSTAVAGLPAKPVLDIDLVLADPANEDLYAPALQAAGFHFHAREPGWHEHRLFKWREPFSHLHVFGPDGPEVIRHVLFRDWLAAHPDDRDLYAAAKRRALDAHSRATPYTGLEGTGGLRALRPDVPRPRLAVAIDRGGRRVPMR